MDKHASIHPSFGCFNKNGDPLGVWLKWWIPFSGERWWLMSLPSHPIRTEIQKLCQQHSEVPSGLLSKTVLGLFTKEAATITFDLGDIFLSFKMFLRGDSWQTTTLSPSETNKNSFFGKLFKFWRLPLGSVAVEENSRYPSYQAWAEQSLFRGFFCEISVFATAKFSAKSAEGSQHWHWLCWFRRT